MSIRTRITLFFLIAFIIPTGIVVALLYHTTRSTLRQNSIRELEALAAWKADKIETYFHLTHNILKDLQGFLTLRQNIPVLMAHRGDPRHPDYVAAKTRLDERMARYQKNYGYLGILVTDTNGIVVYDSSQVGRVGEPLPGPPGQAFGSGMGGAGFNDIYLDPKIDGRPCMLGSGRFEDAEGNFLGVVAIQMDMREVNAILATASSLGASAESYLAKREGESIVYLSPLRFDPTSTLRRRDTLGGPRVRPMQMALLNMADGVGFENDYRGVKTVSAWCYLPQLAWGLVTKVDEREAFAAVRRLMRDALLLGGLALGMGLMAAYGVARSITAPVKALEKGARIIGAGQLEHKVGTVARDEIGSLSRTFDQMAENLRVVYGELSAANRSLKSEIAERIRAEEEVKALLAQRAQMQIAREIQQGLMPRHPPRVPGWDMAGRSVLPEETGGDYFDYIPMAGGRLAVVVGDVSGHGVGPALLMASTRQCLHALALTMDHIAGVLEHAGRLLGDDFGDDKFITLCMAQVEPAGGRIDYLSAGHPHALLMGADGRLKQVLPTELPVLCRMVEMPRPVTRPVDLEAGEALVMLTDGILEALSPAGEEFGPDRVAAALADQADASAATLVDRLFAAVEEFTGHAELQDDRTALIMKRLG